MARAAREKKKYPRHFRLQVRRELEGAAGGGDDALAMVPP